MNSTYVCINLSFFSAIGPSGIRSVFRGRCGYSSRCRRKSLKTPKMTLFGGSPGTPQKWPFLAFFRGHVRSSASYFGIFRKKYVFDKRGYLPRGVPPLGGPPQGGPPRPLPQGVQTPCPNEILRLQRLE